jgi:hypothetical protein
MGAMGHMHRAKAEAGVSMGARRDFDVMTLAQVCVPGLCWKCWKRALATWFAPTRAAYAPSRRSTAAPAHSRSLPL